MAPTKRRSTRTAACKSGSFQSSREEVEGLSSEQVEAAENQWDRFDDELLRQELKLDFEREASFEGWWTPSFLRARANENDER